MSEREELMKARTIADAMRSLRQLREDFSYIVQPDVSCYDRMILLDYIDEMIAATHGVIGTLGCQDKQAFKACRICGNCRRQIYLCELVARAT